MPTPQRSFIALATDGNDAVMIGNDKSVWKQSGATWVQLADIPNVGLKDRAPIAASSYGASDDLVVLVKTLGSSDTELMLYSAGVWTSLGRPPISSSTKHERQIVGLSRYDASDLAVVCDNGDLFVYSSGTWAFVSGPSRRGG